MTESEKKPEEQTAPPQEVETSKLWQEILEESMTKKKSEDTNIFIFGDKSTGKKSLIRAMNKEIESQDSSLATENKNLDENSARFGLIDYELLTVKKPSEEDTETVNKIGVWIANELIDKETFLTFVKPKDILNSICLIVVDYSRPWLIMKSLEKWTKFFYDVFSTLILKLSFDVQNELRDKSKYIFLIKIIF